MPGLSVSINALGTDGFNPTRCIEYNSTQLFFVFPLSVPDFSPRG